MPVHLKIWLKVRHVLEAVAALSEMRDILQFTLFFFWPRMLDFVNYFQISFFFSLLTVNWITNKRKFHTEVNLCNIWFESERKKRTVSGAYLTVRQETKKCPNSWPSTVGIAVANSLFEKSLLHSIHQLVCCVVLFCFALHLPTQTVCTMCKTQRFNQSRAVCRLSKLVCVISARLPPFMRFIFFSLSTRPFCSSDFILLCVSYKHVTFPIEIYLIFRWFVSVRVYVCMVYNQVNALEKRSSHIFRWIEADYLDGTIK